jgi:hypothetical protein
MQISWIVERMIVVVTTRPIFPPGKSRAIQIEKRNLGVRGMKIFVSAAIFLLTVGLAMRQQEASAASSAQGSVVWSPAIRLSTAGVQAWAPAIAADSAGTVHAMWSQTMTGVPPPGEGDTLFYTRWEGMGWSKPVDVLVSPAGAAEWPKMTIAPDGMIHVVWGTGGSGSQLLYARVPACCADDPRRWTMPKALYMPILASSAIVADQQGRLHVVFSSHHNGSVFYRRSDDGGDTWSAPVELLDRRLPGEYTGYPRVAVDLRGRVHVVWTILPFPGTAVMYARSDDEGRTWSLPRMIDSVFRDSPKYLQEFGPYGIDVATRGNDEVFLTWDGAPTVERTYAVSRDGGQTWSSQKTFFPEVTGGGRSGWNVMAVDSANTLHAVTFTSNGPPLHAMYDGSAWSASQRVVTEGPCRTGTELLDMTISRGNTLHIIWRKTDARPFSVWTAQAQISAPALPVVPVLTPTTTLARMPTATSMVGPTVVASLVPLRTPFRPSDFPGSTSGISDPLLGALVGALPAVVLIGVVLFLNLRKHR